MICKCRNCGSSIEWKYGDAEAVCKVCDVKQEVEKSEFRSEKCPPEEDWAGGADGGAALSCGDSYRYFESPE